MEWKKKGFLMLPHSLTNIEIQIYYRNKSKFNGVYSWNNIPKIIKDRAYVENLDYHKSTAPHFFLY